MRIGALLSFLFLAGLLAAQIAAPNPGLVRFPGSPLKTVFGVPGNLLLADSPFPAADAVAFSDNFGLLAAEAKIRLVKRDGAVLAEAPYQGAPPVLNIETTPETAIVWLPAKNALLFWRDDRFERIETSDLAAPVTSASRLSPQTARLLTTNPDATVSAIDISLADGTTKNAIVLPGVHAPAYAFGNQIIYSDQDGLQIETAGARRTLAARSAVFTAERMSAHWVHLYFPAQNQHYALHLAAGPALSLLPAPAAQVKKP
jgi:hypothetical protein